VDQVLNGSDYKAPCFCGAYAALIAGSGVPKIWGIELSIFKLLTNHFLSVHHIW